MLDAIIQGKLHKKPVAKASSNGKQYVTTTVRVPVENADAMFANVIAFDAGPCKALLALDDGDSVALSGSLTPKVWMPNDGAPRVSLDVIAHAVLTAYHVKRKRDALSYASG